MALRIDPWSSTQYKDYLKLREEFGIQDFNFDLPKPHKLFRRKVIFGHRGFESVYKAIKKRDKFIVLTGLMPSGKMHLGHKMTIDQVIYYQSLGANVFIAIADIEAYATRNVRFEQAREIAITEYLANYIALGLKPCCVYFQSKRKEVLDLAYQLALKTNLSEMKSIYGFEDSTNMCHVFAPLVQAGDILHVQLPKYCAPHPTIVPVGVDQDPHIRFTRDLVDAHRLFTVIRTKDNRIGLFLKTEEHIDKLLSICEEQLHKLGYTDLRKITEYKAIYIQDAKEEELLDINEALLNIELEFNSYGFYSPAATYHRLITGLTGDKMSSSKPETAIFLNDLAKEACAKVKNAKTGGAISLEEHRKYGGKPEDCVVFELLLYHLIENDKELEEIYQLCKKGELTCGKCKERAAQLTKEFLLELQDKRAQSQDKIKDYLVEN
ncbi:MAG: tryptophan--tRNA ligase [Candidatus Thermoplasmatota archaeon]